MAVRIGRKHAEEPSTRALPTGSVAGATEPTAKRMYGCIEGIGPTTAMALYEAFPTVSALVDASREDLLAVDGIGETRATPSTPRSAEPRSISTPVSCGAGAKPPPSMSTAVCASGQETQ